MTSPLIALTKILPYSPVQASHAKHASIVPKASSNTPPPASRLKRRIDCNFNIDCSSSVTVEKCCVTLTRRGATSAGKMLPAANASNAIRSIASSAESYPAARRGA